MEGRDFGKRALQGIKNYEKGQYSYFQLLNIKNIFQHYISALCINASTYTVKPDETEP